VEIAGRGLLETTLVIVTSDHGEFLGEHRLFHHLVGPYEAVHRVPLIIRYPGAARRGVEDSWVELVDIVPTVMAVVGAPVRDEVDGEILPRVSHPLLVQQAANPPYERMYGRGLGVGYTGIYDGTRKLVAFDDGRSLLFDLAQDPSENHDLSMTEPAKMVALRARLAGANRAHPRVDVPFTLDPDVQERLRAAGYVQ